MKMTTQHVRLWAAPLFAVLCLVTVGQIYVTEHQQANTAQALTDQRRSLAGDVDTLRTQVTYCRRHPHTTYCRQPAAPPPQVRISQHPVQPVIGQPGATGPTGATGPRGPAATDRQTQDAVNKYLALHPISDGKDGEPGAAPLCLSSPSQCVGPAGPIGPAGPKGDPGDVGPAGQPGQAGQDGRDGTNGVGVSSVNINDDCHVIVTYTDGRTEDAGQVTCPSTDSSNSTPGAAP